MGNNAQEIQNKNTIVVTAMVLFLVLAVMAFIGVMVGTHPNEVNSYTVKSVEYVQTGDVVFDVLDKDNKALKITVNERKISESDYFKINFYLNNLTQDKFYVILVVNKGHRIGNIDTYRYEILIKEV